MCCIWLILKEEFDCVWMSSNVAGSVDASYRDQVCVISFVKLHVPKISYL